MAYLTWDAKAGKPKVEFLPADRYKGEDLYKVYPKLFKKFGKKASIAGCGVAGEYGYANSGIAFNDLLGNRPSRYSGRGGLGAVLASKGLKFIVVDSKGGSGVTITDKALFEQGAKKLA